MEITKKKVGAVLAGTAVFAIVSASAATLGGVNSHSVGADTGEVGSPLENGVVVSWDTAYVDGEYEVAGLTLATKGGETFPAGSDVKVTVVTDEEETVEVSFTPTAATDTLTDDITGIDANDIASVAVVVDGNAVATTQD